MKPILSLQSVEDRSSHSKELLLSINLTLRTIKKALLSLTTYKELCFLP